MPSSDVYLVEGTTKFGDYDNGNGTKVDPYGRQTVILTNFQQDGTPLLKYTVTDYLLAQGVNSYATADPGPTQAMVGSDYLACKFTSNRGVNDHCGPFAVDVFLNATSSGSAEIRAALFSDSAGAPGTNLFTSFSSNFSFIIDPTSGGSHSGHRITLYFQNAGAIAINAATTYWLVFQMTTSPAGWDVQFPLANQGTVTGQTLYSTNGTTWTAKNGTGVYGIHSFAVTPTNACVWQMDSGAGVLLSAHYSYGINAMSEIGDGLLGQTYTGSGIHGIAGVGYGGNFENASITQPTIRAFNGAHGSQIILGPDSQTGPPTTGTFSRGEIRVDINGVAWQCVNAGTPGTWVAMVQSGVLTKTADYTVLGNDPPVIIMNAASHIVTLPSAVTVGNGRQFTVKNGASGTSTTVKSTAGTLDGAAAGTGDTSMTTAYAMTTWISDGSNWFRVG